MKRAPKHEVDLERLCQAAQRSRWVLRRFRNERTRMVQLYLGGHWSDEASWEKQPVNLISLYCQIVGRNLIAKNPSVLLSTFDKQAKPAVATMQGWSNKELVKMQAAETLQRVVFDALFSIGICKVALATPQDAAMLSWNLRAGTPFLSPVDLDDFVADPHARTTADLRWMGHRYRVPLDSVRDSKLFDKARKDLTPSTDSGYNLEGDERVSALLRYPYSVDSEEAEDMVDLWEFYYPSKRLIITLHDDALSGAATSSSGQNPKPVALRTVEWLGPETGPYHFLSYMPVPGSWIGKGPIQDLIDLHESTNRAYRKLERQAARMKSVLGAAGGSMEDAGRVQNANDGDIIRMDHPEQTRAFQMGHELIQPLTAIAVHFKDIFMMISGNLEALGGLAPQAKTLGQDQMLTSNASAGMQSMQQDTINYVSRVCKSLCWYWWHHPLQTMRSKYEIPGMPDFHHVRQVTPQQRQRTRWDDLEMDVDPYSLMHQSPQQRLAAISQTLQQIVLPMMPMAQQQGVGIDLNALLSLFAKLGDMPQLAEVIMFASPPQPEGGQQPAQGPPEMAGKPPETTRNYVRRSLGGNTAGNREQTMLQGMAPHANGQQNRQTVGA